MKRNTRLAITGRNPEQNFGIVNPPVYHASTITFPTLAALEDAEKIKFECVTYGRNGTPTTYALEDAVAEIEGGDRCIVTCSGLAAIVGSILPFVQSGDHILVTDNAYFPTRRLSSVFLKKFGIETTFYDPMDLDALKNLMRPETKVVFMESPGSLSFEIPDIPATVEIAHAHKAVAIFDNTWSGGYFFQPFDHGVDVSVQALTKYIVGHSDAMLGSITMRDELFLKIKTQVSGLGYFAAPDDCYLGLRGLRTLSPRMERHQENALVVAEWLQSRPEVATILHPAFASCPGHEIWKRDFTGSSGLFSFIVHEQSKKAVAAMVDGMDIFALGYSYGGFESLILPSSPRGIRTATRWPHDGWLIRLSIGLEDTDDMIADLDAGLKRLSSA